MKLFFAALLLTGCRAASTPPTMGTMGAAPVQIGCDLGGAPYCPNVVGLRGISLPSPTSGALQSDGGALYWAASATGSWHASVYSSAGTFSYVVPSAETYAYVQGCGGGGGGGGGKVGGSMGSTAASGGGGGGGAIWVGAWVAVSSGTYSVVVGARGSAGSGGTTEAYPIYGGAGGASQLINPSEVVIFGTPGASGGAADQSDSVDTSTGNVLLGGPPTTMGGGTNVGQYLSATYPIGGSVPALPPFGFGWGGTSGASSSSVPAFPGADATNPISGAVGGGAAGANGSNSGSYHGGSGGGGGGAGMGQGGEGGGGGAGNGSGTGGAGGAGGSVTANCSGGGGGGGGGQGSTAANVGGAGGEGGPGYLAIYSYY